MKAIPLLLAILSVLLCNEARSAPAELRRVATYVDDTGPSPEHFNKYMDIEIEGNVLCSVELDGTARSKITCYDISSPLYPSIIFEEVEPMGEFTDYGVGNIVMNDGYLYMYGSSDDSYYKMFRRIDVRQLPTLVDEWLEAGNPDYVNDPPPFSFLSNSYCIFEDTIHFGGGSDRRVIALSSLFSNPQVLTTYTLTPARPSSGFYDFMPYSSDDIAVSHCGTSGLVMIDASRPLSPQSVSIDMPGAWHSTVVGKDLYVTGYDLFVYDISDRLHPEQKITLNVPPSVEQIYSDAQHLYLLGDRIYSYSLWDGSRPPALQTSTATPASTFDIPKGSVRAQHGYLFVPARNCVYLYRFIPETPLTSLSDQTFLVDTLRAEGQVYADRIQQWREPIPEPLRDQPMIMMRDDVRLTTGVETLFQFEIEEPGMVYVGVDERMTDLPAWLESWQPSGLRLATETGIGRRLYQRSYPAGPVKHGCNRDPGDTNPPEYEMYSVFFVSTRASSGAWSIYE